MTLGVDYSAGPPRATKIAAAGFTLAMRYLSPPPNRKNLTMPEAVALTAAGIDIGLVWESTAQRPLAGLAAGVADGARAKALANACGAPVSMAIYFATDWDVQPSQMGAVDAYRAGFASTIAPHPVGVYGGLAACDHQAAQGIRYRWQTAAWSRGRRHVGACLYQRVQQVVIDGVACDVNEVLSDFGGWKSPAPVPTPPPFTPLPPPLTDPEDPSMLVPVQLPPTTDGKGFWDCDGLAVDPVTGKALVGYPRPLIPWEKFRSLDVNGNDSTPADNDRGMVRPNNHGGHLRISFAGFAPQEAALVWVQVAS